jgi:5-methyltetrahydrofolate--homocysteine methyltransferase
MSDRDKTDLLKELLRERILVLDGAMGVAIQDRNLSAADFGGPALEGCNENLVLTRPDVIRDIHQGYLDAGSDIIETNTFGGTALVLAEYDLQAKTREINATAARLAAELARAASTPGKPRFVAGSMGPTTKAITVTGGVTFGELITYFHDQAAALIEGGVDLLLVETCQDTRNTKAALIGIQQCFDEIGFRLPIMVSGTIEPTGTMLAGQSIEAFATSLGHVPLLSIGLNCSTGPEFMTDHIRSLAALTPAHVSCYPNAGLPDAEDGRYHETPEAIARALARFAEEGWVNILGGCCGTTAEHVRAIAQMAAGKRPRVPRGARRTLFSGIDLVEATDDNRPLVVGERTNEIGSRLFRDLIVAERYEEAAEIGRRQVKNGAQVLDVCLQNADRDELADIDRFFERLIRIVKAPIMIDSTDPAAVERALTWCQGKSIINSINLEDGEEKFERVCPLARKYGAALVVGCIDEDPVQAQAITRERKLQIAQRSYQLLTEKYGIPPEDIVWDPLVFPCGTGDANYVGSAVETIEGIRLIKAALPDTKTILGISNVSFGLPPAGREVLNSVFLYHCVKAGLDLAIVNAEKLERYPSIPEAHRKLAEDLLWNRGEDPVAAFTAGFRNVKPGAKKEAKNLTLDQRLANYIVEGTKEGLVADLDRKLEEAAPLEIINGPLMAGMEEVGRLFNNNELIVAEVLQSAEAMKAAVSHLEKFMEKAETSTKGKVILATVKGDVHDIGKNLVEIILANNGYDVVNLGIKVPPETLIAATREHNPNAIGLSGLLVKSAQQMVLTAADLRSAGIRLPLLVGGAALSDRFTRSRIAPEYGELTAYAKDAMTGLDLMNRVMDPDEREKLRTERARPLDEPAPSARIAEEGVEPRTRSAAVSADLPIPEVPDLAEHVLSEIDLDTVWAYVNPQALYNRHLGLKGKLEDLKARGDERALGLERTIDQIKADCRAGLMKARGIWRFFEAEPDGNRLHLFAPGVRDPLHTFTFGRQRRPEGLSLADYVLPPRDGRRDHVALFVTGAGEGIRALADLAKKEGRYLFMHALQALALETAEAAAEHVHRLIREAWGFPDPPSLSMADRFVARYRGKRYSFGYPACPRLEDQEALFKLLAPERIGVRLTEGFMMEPEASVSALVFHHPAARYFTLGNPSDAEGDVE